MVLHVSLLFSVTQLKGSKSQPPVNLLNSALMFGPDVGILLLLLHQVLRHQASVIFFARSFAKDPLLPQLCSGISVNVDVTVSDRVCDDVERNNNGMISPIFISYYCARKFPFHICVSLHFVVGVGEQSDQHVDQHNDR